MMPIYDKLRQFNIHFGIRYKMCVIQTKHRKSYKSNEESSRRGLFMKTEEMIQKHNKNKSKKQPYTLVHNIFSDLVIKTSARL